MNIDIHEPQLIIDLLTPVRDISVNLHSWNNSGYADYHWYDHAGMLEQVERKQVTEILSNIAKVEDQLRQHITKHPDAILWLLIEGIPEPGDGVITVYNKELCRSNRRGTKGKAVYHFVPTWESKIPFERYEGWKTGIERAGIRIVTTNDIYGTARKLAGMEQSSKRPGTTLQRHLKPQTPKHYSPHVMNLLAIGQHREAKSGIDVIMAERMVNVFGDFLTICRLSPEILAEAIPGMGMTKAIQFLKSIGRTDVD